MCVTSGNLQIVFTDYEYAVIFTCEQGHYDNSCYDREADVSIMSRRQQPIPPRALAGIYQTLRTMCHEPGDFVPLDYEGVNKRIACFVARVLHSFCFSTLISNRLLH